MKKLESAPTRALARDRKYLYYHEEKMDFAIREVSKDGAVRFTAQKTSYKSTKVVENPESFGWVNVGELR